MTSRREVLASMLAPLALPMGADNKILEIGESMKWATGTLREINPSILIYKKYLQLLLSQTDRSNNGFGVTFIVDANGVQEGEVI
jgi:hypothetical protein